MGATDDPEAIIEWTGAGIFDGSSSAAHNVENAVGFRDYLFCVGLHISRNSRGRTRSSAISSGGDTFLDCGARSLWLDDCSWRALAQQAPMGVRVLLAALIFVFDYGLLFWAE